MSIPMPALADAACRTTEGERLFARLTPATVPAARAVCEGCPDRADCLRWAVRHETWGMWGGLTRDELNAVRKEHGIRLVELRAGTVQSRPGPPRRSRAEADRLAAIRAWARENGHRVGDRGALPDSVVTAYRQALPEGAAR